MRSFVLFAIVFAAIIYCTNAQKIQQCVGNPCQDPNDDDCDNVPNTTDNCPLQCNAGQVDLDGDGVGDECDNCSPSFIAATDPMTLANPMQENKDGDLWGDACDPCPDLAAGLGVTRDEHAEECAVRDCGTADADGDGVFDLCDTCPNNPNVGDLTAVTPVLTQFFDGNETGVFSEINNTIGDSVSSDCGAFSSDSALILDGVLDGLTEETMFRRVSTIRIAEEITHISFRVRSGGPAGSKCTVPSDDEDLLVDIVLADNTTSFTVVQRSSDNSSDWELITVDIRENPNFTTPESRMNLRVDFVQRMDGVTRTRFENTYVIDNFMVGRAVASPEQFEDADNDGVINACDNCPMTPNQDQADGDMDGVGNMCDNCADKANPDQSNVDGDAAGDMCDDCKFNAAHQTITDAQKAMDTDSDGTPDLCDVCPLVNAIWQSTVPTGFGYHPDADGDGRADFCDNCKLVQNLDQADADSDGRGDACDVCPDNDQVQDAPVARRNTSIDFELSGILNQLFEQFLPTAPDVTFEPALLPVEQTRTCNTDSPVARTIQARDVFPIFILGPTPEMTNAVTDTAIMERYSFSLVAPSPLAAIEIVFVFTQLQAAGSAPLTAAHPPLVVEMSFDGGVSFIEVGRLAAGPIARIEVPSELARLEIPPTIRIGYTQTAGDGFNAIFARVTGFFTAPLVDSDGDGVSDLCDVCPNNKEFSNISDLSQDAARDDTDNDGIPAACDNCPTTSNAGQEDADNDGIGDACDVCVSVDQSGSGDLDGDGIPDACDICPNNALVAISSLDGVNGQGLTVFQVLGHPEGTESRLDLILADAFAEQIANDPVVGPLLNSNNNRANEDDIDGDGIPNVCDNCLFVANADQLDGDKDGIGDACDLCPGTKLFIPSVSGLARPILEQNNANQDSEPRGLEDGVGNGCDNCPFILNPNQTDLDGDGVGNLCDPCPFTPNKIPVNAVGTAPDTDEDGVPDECDPCLNDATNSCCVLGADNSLFCNGQEVVVGEDLCPTDPNLVNDKDSDNDGILDCNDPCPTDPNNPTADEDNDGILDCNDDCVNCNNLCLNAGDFRLIDNSKLAICVRPGNGFPCVLGASKCGAANTPFDQCESVASIFSFSEQCNPVTGGGDGRDNDCDGTVDEGCCRFQTTASGSGLFTGSCTDCVLTNPEATCGSGLRTCTQLIEAQGADGVTCAPPRATVMCVKECPNGGGGNSTDRDCRIEADASCGLCTLPGGATCAMRGQSVAGMQTCTTAATPATGNGTCRFNIVNGIATSMAQCQVPFCITGANVVNPLGVGDCRSRSVGDICACNSTCQLRGNGVSCELNDSTPLTENCASLLDDDCDGAIGSNDVDCNGFGGDFAATPARKRGAGLCTPRYHPCESHDQCCEFSKCLGPEGAKACTSIAHAIA